MPQFRKSQAEIRLRVGVFAERTGLSGNLVTPHEVGVTMRNRVTLQNGPTANFSIGDHMPTLFGTVLSLACVVLSGCCHSYSHQSATHVEELVAIQNQLAALSPLENTAAEPPYRVPLAEIADMLATTIKELDTDANSDLRLNRQPLLDRVSMIQSKISSLEVAITANDAKRSRELANINVKVIKLCNLAVVAAQQRDIPPACRAIGAAASGVFSVVTSWPAVLLIVALIFVRSGYGDRIVGAMRSIRMSPTSLEMELTTDTVRAIEDNLEDAFRKYRKQLNLDLFRIARALGIRAKLEKLFNDPALRGELQDDMTDLRCTLHVEDSLFEEGLLQLVDYYPSGGGAGRAWSSRFGLIGRAWRLKQSVVQGKVPKGKESLIREWGMLQVEADNAGRNRQSFAAILLQTEAGDDVALLYLDHPKELVFGDEAGTPAERLKAERVVEAIIAATAKMKLAEDIGVARGRIGLIGPYIKIYG